ncbi:MAG: hypothetical protein KYX69_09770 [Sphingomonas sp.]|uniref:hypothetical protein n=1 Tax=Sphingomonas sp. TaxID=28214 RepID=UPI002607535D|nr:hypothetical protein [Sphingomonas sp.]MDK2767990.1 hypothetical protein [Sphingomonas sp.]
MLAMTVMLLPAAAMAAQGQAQMPRTPVPAPTSHSAHRSMAAESPENRQAAESAKPVMPNHRMMGPDAKSPMSPMKPHTQ